LEDIKEKIMDIKKTDENVINDLYSCGELKILIKGFNPNSQDIKSIYDKIKNTHKSTNIIILRPELIFGLEHILGIIKIIYEESERDDKKLKNIDVEFLLRICYTNQIKYALDILKCENKNNFDGYIVYILFSKSSDLLMDAYRDMIKLGKDHDAANLIQISQFKRSFILEQFFKKELKFLENNNILKNDDDFQKFLIERAAIAL